MAVVVALLMVPLIGFAAISIDVAAMWSERQQLQTGADAGALAVAQNCARQECGGAGQTAQRMATSNVDGDVTARVSSLGAGEVTVAASGVREHFFAPVLGISSSTIAATSTAGWGSPTGGTALLPLAVSWCEFQAQTGGGLPSGRTNRTITQPLTAESPPAESPPAESPPAESPPAESPPAESPPVESPPVESPPAEPAPAPSGCVGPRGGEVPLGFGWLDTVSGSCRANSSIAAGGATSSADTVPRGCSAADFRALLGRAVLLPIFDRYTGTPLVGRYRIYGYAAFTLTGYHFAGKYDSGGPCSGGSSCISGYFTQSVDLSDQFDYSDTAPRLGAAVVALVQ